MENETPKENKTIIFNPEIAGLKGDYTSSIFTIILGIAAYFAAPKFIVGKVNVPNIELICSIVAAFIILVGVIRFLKLKIFVKCTKYTLNAQRLIIETGFLSKKISNLELWRVVDTELKQSISEMSTGGYTIVLTTQDLSDPILNIKGLSIKKGKEIYEKINEYVAEAMKNSGITKMA